jgi:hypothetical protein
MKLRLVVQEIVYKSVKLSKLRTGLRYACGCTI